MMILVDKGLKATIKTLTNILKEIKENRNIMEKWEVKKVSKIISHPT